MKKSFKKAGAAVLSMAMLLSMGAISMPVYADNPTGATPGKVLVRIQGINGANTNKQGEGKDDTSSLKDGSTGADSTKTAAGYKYDYLNLNNITSANVKLYQVAYFDGSGWHWTKNEYQTAAEAGGWTTWDALYSTERKGSAPNYTYDFNTNSSVLQSIASHLEQAVASDNNPVLKDSEIINYANGQDSVYLDLPANGGGTYNETGYYLIVTDTNQAGVIVQPVLVSLKNEPENPKEVSLKGTTIGVNKKIISIANKDDDTLAETGNVTNTGKSGVVAKNDKVHYELYARLPKYDADAQSIQNFVLEDILDDGLVVDHDSVEAYLSVGNEESESNRAGSTGDNWYIQQGTSTTKDYYIDWTNLSAGNNNGFKFIITPSQLRGLTSDSTWDKTDAAHGLDGNGQAYNKTGSHTMENMYLIVSFDATVDESHFNKGTQDDYTYSNVTGAERTAVTTPNNEKLLEVLSGQSTRYKSETVVYSNDNLKTLVGASDLAGTIQTVTNTNSDSDAKTALNTAAGTIQEKDDTHEDDIVYAGVKTLDMTNADLAAIVHYLFDETSVPCDNPTGAQLTTARKALAYLKDHYLRTKIVLDEKNALKPIGEHNRATLTYGNNYSTGSGSAVIPTDVTTVYSVDVNFDKFAQSLVLTASTATKVEMTGLLAFLKDELSAADADVDTIRTALESDTVDTTSITTPTARTTPADFVKVLEALGYDVNTSDPTAISNAAKATQLLRDYNTANSGSPVSMTDTSAILNALKEANGVIGNTDALADVAAVKSALEGYDDSGLTYDTGYDPTTLTNAVAANADYNAVAAILYSTDPLATVYGDATKDANVKKALARFKAHNTSVEQGKGYDAQNGTTAVDGAVFRLEKVYNGDASKVEDLGYAVSTADGSLKYLTKSATTTNGAAPEVAGTTAVGDVAYVVNEGTASEPAWRTYTVSNKKAWTTLTTGDYKLYEISVPAGYKKWDNPAEFTITADKTGTEYNGDYSASGTSTAYSAASGVSVTKTFDKEFDSTKAILSADLYNEPQDKLPATGGMGTVLFTAGGISVVLIAGALFVMYMKKKNSEDEE